jgi:tRNA-Thr(GGU) m(6)t(6)A37 methyltransferase TsaA
MFTPKAIGFVRSPYTRTADVPRGLGAKHEAVGTVEILREFEPGLLDIEGFSHLFVIWVFDRSETVELTGPSPADHKVHGVFATRSPFRPNPLALTVVELLGREGCALHVKGVDMLDGTPVLDIKPYLSGVAEEKLRRGWLEAAEKAGRGSNPSGVETRS